MLQRKHWICMAAAVLLLMMTLGIAFAVDNGVLPSDTSYTVEECDHEWVLLRGDQPTCTQKGEGILECKKCDLRKQGTVPALGHKKGSWVVTKNATCKAEGVKEITCTRCGETISTKKIPKLEHTPGKWTVTKKATCKVAGEEQTQCTVCKTVLTQSTPKGEHVYGDWKVTKEPTCKNSGKKTAHCKVCGATGSKSIKKTEHQYGDWEITKAATDHTKGTRQKACTFCGKKQKEDYYPEGTMYRHGDNPVDRVKALQRKLKELGFMTKEPTGKYDSTTEKAVSKFQKKNKLKGDGIAWPQTLELLGLGGIGGGDDGLSEFDPSGEISLMKKPLELIGVSIDAEETISAKTGAIHYKYTVTNTSVNKLSPVTVYVCKLSAFDQAKATKIETIPSLSKGETYTGSYTYTPTKDDLKTTPYYVGFAAVGQGSSEKSVAVSNYKLFTYNKGGISKWEKPTITPEPDPEPETEEEIPEGPTELLQVTKTVANAPENKVHFLEGEKVIFVITIMNNGKDPVKDVIATDDMFPKLNGKLGTIDPGKGKKITLEYTVTNLDVGMGGVTNTATVSYPDAEGKLRQQKASVTAPAGLPLNQLMVTKKFTNTPENGQFFIPGEEVVFEITVHNPTSKTYTNVDLYDILHKKGKEPLKSFAKIGANETQTVTFKWKVTDMQAAAGSFCNIVNIKFKDPESGDKVGVSNSCRVPAGFKGSEGMTIVKSVISTPANKSYYQKGEEIRFQIDITNNTLENRSGIEVRDSLAPLDKEGQRTIASDQTVKAGTMETYHFSYIVTEADVKAGKVKNQASMSWRVNRVFTNEMKSNTVTVRTRKSEPKREPVQLEGTACTVKLKAKGDGVAWYDLTECETHAATAAKAKAYISSGDYDKVITLWMNDIDKLYSEWIASADGITRVAAETERAAFKREIQTWRSSLALLPGMTSAKTDRIIAELVMNKCVELCYELHGSKGIRPDSLQSAYNGLDYADDASACDTDVTYHTDGTARFTENQCTTHKLTDTATTSMLADASNKTERTNAWLRAQANWQLDLDNMYNEWYLSSDEAGQELVAADRIAFGDELTARQEVLNDLYPNDPDIVAEALCRMIVVRTQYMCTVLTQAGIITD